jgi:hypothetical protein
MNLSGPIKRIFIVIDHGLISPQSEVCRPTRVMTIHSPESVLKTRLEWALNFLNFISTPASLASLIAQPLAMSLASSAALRSLLQLLSSLLPSLDEVK